MSFPFPLPPWLPWWASLVLVVLALLWGLAFLMVPFSVIGVKARLDGLEARLDEIQEEIRTLALRLPEASGGIAFDEGYVPPGIAPPPTVRRTPTLRPPIPPPAPDYRGGREVPPPLSAPSPPRRPERAEPRLDPRR